MQEQVPMIQHYHILRAKNLETLEKVTEEMMREGWQIAGAIGVIDGEVYHEMIKFEPDQQAIRDANQANQDIDLHFHKAYDEMNPKVRDLLEINNINLTIMDGVYYTTIDNKTTEGINAHDILAQLKKSKHYPVDMLDETVINAIEGLV